MSEVYGASSKLRREHEAAASAQAAFDLAVCSEMVSLDLPIEERVRRIHHLGEGNLIKFVRCAGPAIGEVQVADVPGRCEPGTGELNYTAIASALQEVGYAGVVGLEAYASEDDVVALERFRSAFTLRT